MSTIPKPLLSIVVPVFKEASILPIFHQRLSAVLNKLSYLSEIIYVNDGSSDNSFSVLQDLQKQDARIGILDLSRNFGKEIALSAGLDFAKGDAVIVIDADLQDPPELIPVLISRWKEGFDIVYAKRHARKGESWFKKTTAYLFYRLINKISTVQMPKDTGDFRLLSRRTVEALKRMPERRRFMKGLFAWIGYPQIAVMYERDPRIGGETKWNYWKLWNFAIEGITSFTIAPLKLATYIGFTTALVAFFYGMMIIYKTLCFGESVQGYPSLMVVILFLGGVQLITLGIIGEYLGRTFDEVKQRPLYLLNDYSPALLDSLAMTKSNTSMTDCSVPPVEEALIK